MAEHLYNVLRCRYDSRGQDRWSARAIQTPETRMFTQLMRAAVAALLAAAMPHASGQEWPTRPVRVILPFPAGGSTDTLTRVIGDKLGKRLGQPFVVENKPGASTLIGTSEVVRSTPDGGTVLLNASNITSMQFVVKTDFDVRRDLRPVTILRGGVLGLWANASAPFNDLRGFIAYAKANPGKMNYATQGSGSLPHIEFVRLAALANIDLVPVNYKGEAPAIQGLLANEVQTMLGSFLLLGEMSKTGKVKLLAVTGAERMARFPDAPTFIEQELPYTAAYWSGYFFPRATPMPIVRRMQTELKAVYQMPDVYALLTNNGESVGGQTPEEFEKQVNAEAETWEKTIKAAGIKAE
jgi:tripartite-type tricarboxylate transporter receptor subunit TctC